MAAENKYLLPAKVPPCEDAYQAQRAAEERIRGFEEECLPPLNMGRRQRQQ